MADVASCIAGVVSAVVQVGQCLAASRHQFKYLLNYDNNFVNLQEQVNKLNNARDEVQRKVIAAENKLEEIKENVKIWQVGVEKMIIEAEQLIEEKKNNPRCFKGLCPSFIIHCKQSKKAFKLKQNDIDPLLEQEKELDPVSNPAEIWLRTSEDYLTFESRISTMKNVWDALNNENVFMIGVYGMGGLGKTTLVQEIGRKAKKENLFEKVVFVEVSESPDIKKIQTTIADKLKLEYNNESERASEIYSAMEKRKILLILDNVWKDVVRDKEVGIPRGANLGRSKLLFTTRNVDVLQRMGSTSNFGMGFLNEDEAWTLFTKMAGDGIQSHEFEFVAKRICNECGGLPIVICTIAKALKDKPKLSRWDDALRQLQAPPLTNFTRPLEESHKKIKLSYDYLEDDKLKKTFIICSLMENDSSILDLLKNIMSMGILELPIEAALVRLEVLVDELKERCLLLDGGSESRFSMHDIVRVVAVTCAYIDYHVYTEKNDVEKEWKDKDELGLCTTISLVGNDIITQLWPEGLNCLKLQFFQASQMGSSQIPEGFLIMMPELRVLNLFEMQQSLQSLSIDRLTNVQSLCLDGSKIKDVTVIGTLKKLKVLSLQNTLIKEFHTNMGQLTHLELLDLSCCQKLKVIAPNVISQLSKLEAFYIKSCSIEWNRGLLVEVKLLSKLTILELDVEDINVFPEGFFSKEPKRYNISIGRRWWPHFRNDKLECWRILQFKFNSSICLEKLHGIKNVQVLQLGESSDEKNETRPLFNEKVILTGLMTLELFEISFEMIWESQLSTSSCENLTQLLLDGCNNIKYVFPFSVAKSLKELRFLKIKGCKILEKIIKEEEEGAEVVESIFPQLTKLRFRDLPKLRVFYQGVHALELPILKRLKVRNCPNFTGRYQYFQKNNEEEDVVLESKSICLEHKINSDLEVMKLRNDNRWIEWCGKDKTLDIFDANISVELLKGFSNVKVLNVVVSSLEPKWMSEVIFTDLMTLDLFNNSYEMMWGSQLSTSSCKNLTKFSLGLCDNIKFVFPFFVAKSLKQLRFLEIKHCEVLEQIIEEEEGAEVVYSIFPQLTELILDGCHNIKYVFPFFVAKSLKQLQFPQLTTLILDGCDNIKYVFPFFVVKSLKQLQFLVIEDCKILEKIIEEEEGAEVVYSIFPQLTKLKLKGLPKLRVFYQGVHALELPILKSLEVQNCPIFRQKISILSRQ